MKKKKLNLSELKVQSFITKLENGMENTVKGGNDPEYRSDGCKTHYYNGQNACPEQDY